MNTLKNTIEHTFLLPTEIKEKLLWGDHGEETIGKVTEFFDRYGHIEHTVLTHIDEDLKNLTNAVHAYIEQQETLQEAKQAKQELDFIMV